jgi:choline-phosphate cytidylyltransferase
MPIGPADVVVVVIVPILPGPRPGVTMTPMSSSGSRTVITFGTFDVFHVGHLRVLERAAALGDRLVVGVSADALNLRKKGREPVFSQSERLEIIAALRMVDEVFVEESLEQKREYIERYAADVLVMGDDWRGRFDEFGDICEVVYLPRTPAISTTALIEKISASG